MSPSGTERPASPLADAFADFLRAEGCDVMDGWAGSRRIVEAHWGAEPAVLTGEVFTAEGARQLAFVTVLPGPVPTKARRRVEELIGRVNWQLVVGNFEIDPDGDEVRFRTSLALAVDEELSEALLARLVDINRRTIDSFSAAFADVLAGASAQEALARIGWSDGDA